MRVFTGCYDIASVLSGVTEGFRLAGHSVTSFVLERNKFYPDAGYDVIKELPIHSRFRYNEVKIPGFIKAGFQKADSLIYRKQLKRLTHKLIDEHDLFVFIWRPWLDEQYLFPLIKQKGKKIVCLQLGSDVRHIAAYKQEYNEDVSLWEQYFHDEDLNEKIKKIRTQELYADAIFSVPDQVGLAIRGYNHLHIPIRNLNKIRFNIPDRKIPVIIHAPSRSGIKGTSIILATLERLKNEGIEFELRLLQNLPNHELINQLSDADILIDEILLHGPGVLSFEAMAAGTLVVTRTIRNHKDIFDPPVVDIKPYNVYEKIKHILLNRNNYTDYLEKGRKYVELNNTPKNIAENILCRISVKETDYFPDFFSKKFELSESQTLSAAAKQLNREVFELYGKPNYDFASLTNRGLI